MSIILKGIDLPKEGKVHRIVVFPNGRIALDFKTYVEEYEAIQIPKGARLIDANKLEFRRCDDSASRATFDYVDEWDLEDAPTILEDEEEEVPFKEVVKDYITETYGDINNL